MQGPELIDCQMVDSGNLLGFLNIFSVIGQPVISVPAGRTADGLPVGMQIVGRHLADADVLGGAAALEPAQGWRDRWCAPSTPVAGNVQAGSGR
ncbi:hypothetical protein IDF66_13545 [Gordonia hankookensis]|uniref:Amidase domain-containing protein n=2 Tax=Gordonia hankookensis TaxID=589403 RepID=A0ABR7WCT8_9ACTN|nr:hypothetical protein [Gordonia hankookensis]